MREFIKSVTITACEGKNGVDRHYPKTLNSLTEATGCINGDSFVNGKIRFNMKTNTGDEYEGKAYKTDDFLDLESHVREHLDFVINSKNIYKKPEEREAAKKWLEILTK